MKKILMIVFASMLIIGTTVVGSVYAKTIPGTAAALLEELEDPDFELVCSGEMDHPELLELALAYSVDYEVLETYYCAGVEVVDIQLALETAAHDGVELTFEEILAMRFVEGEEVMTWEEIWALLEITDMEVPEEEEEEEEEDSVVCSGEMIHPVLTSLAEEYMVDYQTLLGYFCQGFGVGEIKLALQTASKESVLLTYEELLGMRLKDGEEEMGWGEIWQELGLIGKNKQNTEQTQDMQTLEYKKNNKPAVPPGQAKDKPDKGKGN